MLSIRLLETNFNAILLKMQWFSFKMMHLVIFAATYQPFCSGLNSLWSCDAIWHHRTWSTWVQVRLVVIWHQAIIWTNVPLSSNVSCATQLRAISQEMLMKMFVDYTLNNTTHLPGANQLMYYQFANLFHSSLSIIHQGLSHIYDVTLVPNARLSTSGCLWFWGYNFDSFQQCISHV